MIAGACGRFFIFQSGSVAIITASSYGKRYETNSPEQWKEGQRVTSFGLYDGDEKRGKKTTHWFFSPHENSPVPPLKTHFKRNKLSSNHHFRRAHCWFFREYHGIPRTGKTNMESSWLHRVGFSWWRKPPWRSRGKSGGVFLNITFGEISHLIHLQILVELLRPPFFKFPEFEWILQNGTDFCAEKNLLMLEVIFFTEDDRFFLDIH